MQKSVYGNGDNINYSYDSFGRVIGKVIKDSSGNKDGDYSYQYDNSGNLGYMCDNVNNSWYRYVYDSANRPVMVEDDDGNYYRHDYDKNNNTSKFTDYVNSNKRSYSTSYLYDKDNKPTITTMNSGVKATNSYESNTANNIGRLTSKTLTASGASSPFYKTSYTYSAGGFGGQSTTNKIESIQNGSSDPIYYKYDGKGNIQTIKQNGQTITYTYNELNEFTREDNPVLKNTIIYSYDSGGNIQTKTVYPYTTVESPTGALNSYTYLYQDSNWKDKLTGYVTKDGQGNVIKTDAIGYKCDGDADSTTNSIGNPDSYNGWNLQWQMGRQLQSMANSSLNKNITFKYDDAGIRTQKVIKDNSGNVVSTTNYHLVGNKVTYEDNGTDKIYYTYDSSDNLVSMNLTCATNSAINGEYYYIRNAQGDIIGLIDKNGAQVVSYSYDSWGKPVITDAEKTSTTDVDDGITGTLASTVGVKNPYRYRGYRYDSETQLYYLNSRYYNADWGRFINEDALGGSVGELLSHNIFAYCKNNPVSMSDPDGTRAFMVADGDAGGAVGPGGGEGIASRPGGGGASEGMSATERLLENVELADVAPEVYEQSIMERKSSSGTVKYAGNNVSVYRGGNDLTVKQNEVRINKGTGLVEPKRGISVNVDASKVSRFGGAYRIDNLPEGLKIEQKGADPGHFEIIPEYPMTLEEFQNKLNEIEVFPVE